MHDVVAMQVLQTEHYLLEDLKGLPLLQNLALLEILKQLLALDELGNHVEVLAVLEKTI